MKKRIILATIGAYKKVTVGAQVLKLFSAITVRKGMNIKSLYDSLRDHKWLIALNKQK